MELLRAALVRDVTAALVRDANVNSLMPRIRMARLSDGFLRELRRHTGTYSLMVSLEIPLNSRTTKFLDLFLKKLASQNEFAGLRIPPGFIRSRRREGSHNFTFIGVGNAEAIDRASKSAALREAMRKIVNPMLFTPTDLNASQVSTRFLYFGAYAGSLASNSESGRVLELADSSRRTRDLASLRDEIVASGGPMLVESLSGEKIFVVVDEHRFSEWVNVIRGRLPMQEFEAQWDGFFERHYWALIEDELKSQEGVAVIRFSEGGDGLVALNISLFALLSERIDRALSDLRGMAISGSDALRNQELIDLTTSCIRGCVTDLEENPPPRRLGPGDQLQPPMGPLQRALKAPTSPPPPPVAKAPVVAEAPFAVDSLDLSTPPLSEAEVFPLISKIFDRDSGAVISIWANFVGRGRSNGALRNFLSIFEKMGLSNEQTATASGMLMKQIGLLPFDGMMQASSQQIRIARVYFYLARVLRDRLVSTGKQPSFALQESSSQPFIISVEGADALFGDLESLTEGEED